MKGKILIFCSDEKLKNKLLNFYKKNRNIIEVRPIEEFCSTNILQLDFNNIIVDNQDASLEKIERVKSLLNEALKINKNINFFFLVCYFERDVSRKTFQVVSLSGALFNYAWELQWRAGDNKSINYDKIKAAYQEAAREGSEKANQWLKEQDLPSIKPNRIWSEPYRMFQVNKVD
jgi:hypothetical protein